MIPKPIIEAWREFGDWPYDYQVEQDLIISRLLVAIFNDKLAFRGGTALHKLVFPKALRYSEDIDLNRLETGEAKPLIQALRKCIKPILGKEKSVDQTKNSIKMKYDFESIEGTPKRIKIEINSRERVPRDELWKVPYSVKSQYFSGETILNVFPKEEMIGTKIRALYQRRKGRDLFDLYEARNLEIDWDKVVESYKSLSVCNKKSVFLENLDQKMRRKDFSNDMKLLLPTNIQYDSNLAYEWFIKTIIPRLD